MPNPIRPTLLGVPFDGGSSYQRGAALAPGAIREFLRWGSSNTWTEDGLDIFAPGIMADAGDVEFAADQPWTDATERRVGDLLARGDTPLILGGDHAITFPIVKAVAAKYPELAILHFDAHGDLYDSYDGDRLSHACPFARIMEQGLASRLVQVGIRTLNDHQREQVKRFGVEVHEMRHWSGPFTAQFDGPVYLSLDLDALDPAFAAGISHPEPGGLSVRDIVTMIQRLDGRLIGADVVEFNPTNDSSSRTGLVAAKLVKEIVSACHRTNR